MHNAILSLHLAHVFVGPTPRLIITHFTSHCLARKCPHWFDHCHPRRSRLLFLSHNLRLVQGPVGVYRGQTIAIKQHYALMCLACNGFPVLDHCLLRYRTIMAHRVLLVWQEIVDIYDRPAGHQPDDRHSTARVLDVTCLSVVALWWKNGGWKRGNIP